MSGFSLYERAVREGKTAIFLGKSHNQTILEISQGDYISATADFFRTDRQARGLS